MKIKLLTPVDHDGARRDEGDTIDVTDAAAAALIAAGAAEVVAAVARKAKAAEPDAQKAE